MTTTVYSFSDVNMVIIPPGVSSYVVNGKGIGEVAVNWANDNTVHDLAADGSVMVSKIKADNGTIAITMQQTSILHQYLKDTFNKLMNSDVPALWAATTITISSLTGTFHNIIATGVSFTKRGDQPFQQQGQRITWNFMVANLQTYGTLGNAITSNASVLAQIVNNI